MMRPKFFWKKKKKKSDDSGLMFPKTATPKSELKLWIGKCDRIFSQFIRMRDCSQKDYDVQGVGRCITCGIPITFKSCDAGHYIGREHMGTRFHEKNSHAQCRSCNRFHEGEKAAYAAEMLRRYGQDEIDKLLFLKQSGRRFHVYELKLIYQEYKSKVDLMK